MSSRSLLALIFLASLAVGWSYGPLEMPLVGDNKGQFFMAERAASGVPIHASLFSPKNGLGFLCTSGAILVARAVGVDDVLASRALSLLVTAASVTIVASLARRVAGTRAAAVGAALAMLSFQGYLYQAALGSRPKTYLVAFICLLFVAVSRDRPFLIGLFGAACFLCWQPALLLLAAVAVLVPSRSDRRRWVTRTAGGAFVAVGAYELYYLAHGMLAEQLFQAYVFPSRFMLPEPRDPAGLFRAFGRIWIDGYHWANPAPAFFGVAVLVFWRAVARRRCTPERLFFFTAAHGALLFTFLEKQGYIDFFLLVPFLGLAAGVGMGRLWSDGGAQPARRLAFGASALVFAVLAATGFARGSLRTASFELADQREAARRLRELEREHGEVFAIGTTHLLALERSSNWSPYSSFYRGVTDCLHATRDVGGPDLPWEARPLPPLIVLSSKRLPDELQEVLRREYELITPALFADQRMRVMRRRPPAE